MLQMRTPQRLQAFRKFIVKTMASRTMLDSVRSRPPAPGLECWPERLREGNNCKNRLRRKRKKLSPLRSVDHQEQLEALAKERAHAANALFGSALRLHADSYDVWRYRKFFVPGMAVAAPPDPVFTKGTDWGFPPMNPEAMRLNRYQYLIACVRNHFHFARLLRIDHVMGLPPALLDSGRINR